MQPFEKIEKMSKNNKYKNENYLLLFSCSYYENINTIKYLIENRTHDINFIDDDGRNCLLLACRDNNNLEIIKYLIENYKFDINFKGNYNNNCLLFACHQNNNLLIIK